MGYKISLLLCTESGKCEWNYLNGFNCGKPILVGRARAKVYKTVRGVEKAFEKWLGYYEKDNIVVYSCKYVDEVN